MTILPPGFRPGIVAPQNLDHIVIGPVVEDYSEKECVSFHGLIMEEIMLHELNPFCDILRKCFFGIEHRPGKILDHKANSWRRLSNDSADVSFRAADVNNDSRATAQAGPRKILSKPDRRQTWPVGESGHGAREPFGHRWVGSIILPDRPISLLCHGPSLTAVNFINSDYCALLTVLLGS